MYELRVLGSPRLVGPDGHELRSVLSQPKRLALLSYLAVTSTGAYVRRDKLIGLLWAESTERRARASLSEALSKLRKSLDAAVISTRGDEEVGVDAGELRCDAVEFVRAVDAEDWTRAVEVYAGPLLDGVFLDGCPEFDLWLEHTRAHLKRSAVSAFGHLTEQAIAAGDDSARALAERAFEIDPLDGGAVLRLMQVLAQAGQRDAALGVYERYAAAVREERGIEPSSDTMVLVERIRAGRLERRPDRRGDVDAAAASPAGVGSQPATPPSETVGRLNEALEGHYRLEREIGQGGMATVYLAEDLKRHRRVAIKVLKREPEGPSPDRFLRETEIVAGLDHPHILPLFDSGEAGGSLYYVMPYVEGESLRQKLNREKQLAVDEVLGITAQVADALDFAHEHGVVHRDIKPDNILITGNHARVADFGIARAVTVAGGKTLTETGLALGTPAYMSPEQASGDRAVDSRSDVYSLASVVYEMLTGQPPFAGATAAAILARKVSEPVPSLRVVRDAVPASVEAAVTRALNKVPADRFATASDFAEALRRGWSEPVPASPMAGVLTRRRLLVAVGLATTISAAGWLVTRQARPPRIQSIAVLPLVNLTGDPAQDYFVQGMHEALTAELSKLSAVKVISRTSAMRYRDTDKAMPQIARELGVEGLVEGSVSREDDQVRITVNLIDGVSDRHLWGDTYQRELRGVLVLQREVARDITTQIRARLTTAEATRLGNAPPVDPQAYEEWLRGQYHFNKLSLEGWNTAIEHFHRSIERDASYAPAHAMLSFTYSWLAYYDILRPAYSAQALRAAEQALALDPSLAEAHASLALAKTVFEWDWTGADLASAEALRLDPSSPVARHARGSFLSFVGRHDEAIATFSQAVDLDPVAPSTNTLLAISYFFARRYEKAIEQLKKVVSLEADYHEAHLHLLFSFAKMERFEEAERELAILDATDMSLEDPPWWRRNWLLALEGNTDEARQLLQQNLAEHPTALADEAYFLAIVLGELGEKDKAFDALQSAYEHGSPFMSVLKVDPRIDALRDDTRFGDLLRRMKFPS